MSEGIGDLISRAEELVEKKPTDFRVLSLLSKIFETGESNSGIPDKFRERYHQVYYQATRGVDGRENL